MSAVIWPITEAGSNDRPSDLLRYAQRDFYGVESPAASPTDFRGFNEMIAFTRRTETAALVEHFASGLHNSVKIARLFCVIGWDAAVYTFTNPSYSQVGSTGVRTYGSSVGTAARAAAGVVNITLTDPLPAATNYKLLDFTGARYDADAPQLTYVRVMLDTVTDSTHFTVKRLETSTTLATMVAFDGSMRFAIYY